MSFKDFNFKTFIQEALDEIKFKEPTPVQQKLIPVVRSGRDLVGESKTGSGKTHTFLLPIFEKLNPKRMELEEKGFLKEKWRCSSCYYSAIT